MADFFRMLQQELVKPLFKELRAGAFPQTVREEQQDEAFIREVMLEEVQRQLDGLAHASTPQELAASAKSVNKQWKKTIQKMELDIPDWVELLPEDHITRMVVNSQNLQSAKADLTRIVGNFYVNLFDRSGEGTDGMDPQKAFMQARKEFRESPFLKDYPDVEMQALESFVPHMEQIIQDQAVDARHEADTLVAISTMLSGLMGAVPELAPLVDRYRKDAMDMSVDYFYQTHGIDPTTVETNPLLAESALVSSLGLQGLDLVKYKKGEIQSNYLMFMSKFSENASQITEEWMRSLEGKLAFAKAILPDSERGRELFTKLDEAFEVNRNLFLFDMDPAAERANFETQMLMRAVRALAKKGWFDGEDMSPSMMSDEDIDALFLEGAFDAKMQEQLQAPDGTTFTVEDILTTGDQVNVPGAAQLMGVKPEKMLDPTTMWLIFQQRNGMDFESIDAANAQAEAQMSAPAGDEQDWFGGSPSVLPWDEVQKALASGKTPNTAVTGQQPGGGSTRAATTALADALRVPMKLEAGLEAKADKTTTSGVAWALDAFGALGGPFQPLTSGLAEGVKASLQASKQEAADKPVEQRIAELHAIQEAGRSTGSPAADPRARELMNSYEADLQARLAELDIDMPTIEAGAKASQRSVSSYINDSLKTLSSYLDEKSTIGQMTEAPKKLVDTLAAQYAGETGAAEKLATTALADALRVPMKLEAPEAPSSKVKSGGFKPVSRPSSPPPQVFPVPFLPVQRPGTPAAEFFKPIQTGRGGFGGGSFGGGGARGPS